MKFYVAGAFITVIGGGIAIAITLTAWLKSPEASVILRALWIFTVGSILDGIAMALTVLMPTFAADQFPTGAWYTLLAVSFVLMLATIAFLGKETWVGKKAVGSRAIIVAVIHVLGFIWLIS